MRKRPGGGAAFGNRVREAMQDGAVTGVILPAMSLDPFSLVLAAASFALTFLVARTLGRWWRNRSGRKDEEARRAGESRQVRRSRERKRGGR